MSEQPTPKELCASAGISQSYASMILGGQRSPSRSRAIQIFRATGWRHSVIADLTAEEIDTLERIEARAA